MFVGSLIGVCGWILLANSWDKTSLFLGRIITTASGSGLSATTSTNCSTNWEQKSILAIFFSDIYFGNISSLYQRKLVSHRIYLCLLWILDRFRARIFCSGLENPCLRLCSTWDHWSYHNVFAAWNALLVNGEKQDGGCKVDILLDNHLKKDLNSSCLAENHWIFIVERATIQTKN